jgi:hypothetical protein
MTMLIRIASCASALREFVAPTYRPERHYMRGPGPACARRAHAAIEVRIPARVRYQ